MTAQETREILRLDRLERAGRAYYERAKDKGNRASMLRAARLQTAAYAKAMAIVGGNISSFH
jgi:hypothetical protein